MLTLLYFSLAEPDNSSPLGQELGEVSVLPSKASGRIQVSFTQAPFANGIPSPGTPQGDTDNFCFLSVGLEGEAANEKCPLMLCGKGVSSER